MRDSFEITYAAHTNSCTFLLDSEGVCRRIVPSPSLKRSPKGRDAAAAATRCVGAQYVASLDSSVPGMLAEMPRVGISMIFARVDERGRVSLVRTGVVTRFESHRAEDPFAERAPSISVETSAPVIPPSKPSPRRPREAVLSRQAKAPDTTPALDEPANLAQTAEYERPTRWSPAQVDRNAPPPLRRPPGVVPPQSEPRRTEAYATRPRAERPTRSLDPARTARAGGGYPPVENAAGRRSSGG